MKTVMELNTKELRRALDNTYTNAFTIYSDNIRHIVESDNSICMMACDVFNYGIMIGKHIE